VSGADASATLAWALVDEWARAGVVEAVLAPGSRSAPLALALAADERIRLSVFLDERSAAFFALGAAKASGRPVAVLSTSGTAAANFHAAVLEARHARVPLIVCTADRPPELRDTGAGQTIDQVKLYGDAVRWFVEVGAPEDFPHAGRYWRSIGARSVTASLGPPAGPVHLNLAFREPLVPTGAPLVEADGRPGGVPWTDSRTQPAAADPRVVATLAAAVNAHARGVVVAGWGSGVPSIVASRFAGAAGWPVLADPISDLRCGPAAISTYDPLARAGRLPHPEIVLQIGAPLTNRPARERLDGAPIRLLIDPHGEWLDPARSATHRILGEAQALLRAAAEQICSRAPASSWLDGWQAEEAVARAAIDDLLDGWDEPFEGRVARDVAACLPHGSTVVVGSSMPVRDVESFVAPRDGLRWLANRGANGIDGFTSTVLGVARAADGAGPVVGLLGDLTLLHDAGGLLHAADRGLDATLVVLDNDGGGIFSFLPQAGLPEHFETVFGAPHGVDLLAVAAAYGVAGVRVDQAAEVAPAVLDAIEAGGVRLVVVPTDRAGNVDRHRQVWDALR